MELATREAKEQASASGWASELCKGLVGSEPVLDGQSKGTAPTTSQNCAISIESPISRRRLCAFDDAIFPERSLWDNRPLPNFASISLYSSRIQVACLALSSKFSITFMFATASSSGVGTGVLFRIASENASP